MSSLHPQLAALQTQLDEATARAVRLVESTDEGRFNRRPREGAWSVAECLEHLSLTTKAFLPLIDEALAAGAATGVAETHRYRRDPAGWALAWMLEPPFRVKVKTTRPFEPEGARSRREVLDEFAALQRELSARVAGSNGRDLGRLRVASPFNARVRYNLYSAFCVLLAHERRHLWQAERALEQQPQMNADQS